MGPQAHQLLATLCVTLSLSPFALGGADLAGTFCLRTLSYSRPTIIVEPVLDTIAISHAVVGALCRELRRCVNMGLLRPSTVHGKGIKLAAILAHTYVLSHELPSPPHLLPYA
jgi:hypothetical protein